MAFQCSRMLASRQLTGCLFRNIRVYQFKYPVCRSAATVASSGVEDFDEKNARLRRPQSPHLTIYKPQLTSVLSFTHRTTGVVLGGIMSIWGLGGLFWSGSFPELYASLQDMHLPAVLIISAKACIAFPLAYHYANGIRHLRTMYFWYGGLSALILGFSLLVIMLMSSKVEFRMLQACLRRLLLVWDMGKFLSLKEVYTTGYAVLGISAVLTAILVAL